MATNKIIESEDKLGVINIGLDGFANDMRQQDVSVVDVDWYPPADGDPNLNEILKTINFDQDLLKRINNANKKVIERVKNANPQVVDIISAEEALELPIHTILHSGPPIEWDRMCGPQKRAVLGAIQFEGWADDEGGEPNRLHATRTLSRLTRGSGSGTAQRRAGGARAARSASVPRRAARG